MDTFLTRMFTALILIAALGGSATTRQESAMEWMLSQPVFTDP